MKRYILLEDVTVAVFNNPEVAGMEDAIFPGFADIDEALKRVKEELPEEVALDATYYTYRKGDILEKEKLDFWEENMKNFRLLEERSIEESIKVNDKSVKVEPMGRK